MSTLVSSMYGFICGAYMPINSFGEGMKSFVCFIPGTYGTILFRQYYMNGIIAEMSKTLPQEMLEGIREGFDYTFKFFGTEIETGVMFLILSLSVAVLFVLFIVLSNIKNKKVVKEVSKNNQK